MESNTENLKMFSNKKANKKIKEFNRLIENGNHIKEEFNHRKSKILKGEYGDPYLGNFDKINQDLLDIAKFLLEEMHEEKKFVLNKSRTQKDGRIVIRDNTLVFIPYNHKLGDRVNFTDVITDGKYSSWKEPGLEVIDTLPKEFGELVNNIKDLYEEYKIKVKESFLRRSTNTALKKEEKNSFWQTNIIDPREKIVFTHPPIKPRGKGILIQIENPDSYYSEEHKNYALLVERKLIGIHGEASFEYNPSSRGNMLEIKAFYEDTDNSTEDATLHDIEPLTFLNKEFCKLLDKEFKLIEQHLKKESKLRNNFLKEVDKAIDKAGYKPLLTALKI